MSCFNSPLRRRTTSPQRCPAKRRQHGRCYVGRLRKPKNAKPDQAPDDDRRPRIGGLGHAAGRRGNRQEHDQPDSEGAGPGELVAPGQRCSRSWRRARAKTALLTRRGWTKLSGPSRKAKACKAKPPMSATTPVTHRGWRRVPETKRPAPRHRRLGRRSPAPALRCWSAVETPNRAAAARATRAATTRSTSRLSAGEAVLVGTDGGRGAPPAAGDHPCRPCSMGTTSGAGPSEGRRRRPVGHGAGRTVADVPSLVHGRSRGPGHRSQYLVGCLRRHERRELSRRYRPCLPLLPGTGRGWEHRHHLNPSLVRADCKDCSKPALV